MKKLILLILILTFCVNVSFSLPNPAAVYCKNLGYEYKIVKTSKGEYGECIFPDKSKCDEWEFLEGKCGQDYSYCKKNGYDIKIKTDGKNPYSPEYAVCVPKIAGQKEMAVTDTIKLVTDLNTDEIITTETPTVTSTYIPSSFDWRNKDGYNWMTPVKDQDSCGSCWAFATLGTLEAGIKIENNDPNINPDLSEQDLVSCGVPIGFYPAKPYWGGCGGVNNTGDALPYIKNTGVVDEPCFPYTARDDPCVKCSDWQNRIQKISGWSDYINKEDLVNNGPILSSIHMGGEWEGGIYRCYGPPDRPNHIIVIVGYNDVDNYWIVKNSYGSTWLNNTPYYDNGYFKVYYNNCSIQPRYIIYYKTSGENPIITSPVNYNSTTKEGYYYKTYIPLNFIINFPTSWIGYSLDGKPNITITGSINLTPIADGSHNTIVYARDSSGNEYSSNSVNFYYCASDLNKDGKRDVRDVSFVSSLFGIRSCNDTRYDARADLNNDCRIDAKDVTFVSRYYGVACPAPTLPAFTLPYTLGVETPLISFVFVILIMCLYLVILTLLERLKII